MVSGDFKKFSRRAKPMNLIKDDAFFFQLGKKALRIAHHLPYTWQFAIEVFDLFKTLRKKGLTRSPDA
jgi:hypothetical protein